MGLFENKPEDYESLVTQMQDEIRVLEASLQQPKVPSQSAAGAAARFVDDEGVTVSGEAGFALRSIGIARVASE
jgi:hypothetical protein